MIYAAADDDDVTWLPKGKKEVQLHGNKIFTYGLYPRVTLHNCANTTLLGSPSPTEKHS